MSEWAPKRFYEEVSVEAEDGGFAVRLDGRPIRTPGKNAIVMPSAEMAEAVAEEWRAQEDQIDPTGMPWTRSVNSAIDKVGVQRDEVIDHLASYGGTDLLCYRADGPEGLVQRQAEAWDPLIDWLNARCEVQMQVTSGVMPVSQEAVLAARLRQPMEHMSDFHLTGFHDLVTLSGSFVLALSTAEKQHSPDEMWSISRIDETWQIEQWGEDEEAAEAAKIKHCAFLHAAKFYFAA